MEPRGDRAGGGEEESAAPGLTCEEAEPEEGEEPEEKEAGPEEAGLKEEAESDEGEEPVTTSSGTTRDLDPDYKIPSRTPSGRRRPSRTRTSTGTSTGTSNSDPQNHLSLKVRFLEDPQTWMLSNLVFQRSPVLDLLVPPGLQESGFLDLLRSRFQLDQNQDLDLLTSDRSRRLRPLQVQTRVPEEIQQNLVQVQGGLRAAVLYIRPKTPADPQNQNQGAEVRPPQNQQNRADGTDCSSATTSATQTRGNRKSRPPRSRSPRDPPRNPPVNRKRGRPRSDPQGPQVLRISVLEEENPEDGVPEDVLQRSAVQDLQVPRGLQESGFLDLLRSRFPQLAGSQTRFHLFKLDRNRRLQRLRPRTLNPEEIQRSQGSGLKRPVLYVKLKMEEETAVAPSPGSQDRDQDQDPQGSGSEDDPGGAGDQDWKPDPGPPKRRRRASGAADVRTSCRVCGVWYRNLGSLVKHAWTHLDPAGLGGAAGPCGVCGQSPGPDEDLQTHLRNHHKIHRCSVCPKAFIRRAGLSEHEARHAAGDADGRFRCAVCGRGFASRSGLSNHCLVQHEDKPHRCAVCRRGFGLQSQLEAHRRLHLRRDTYRCNVCGKTVNNRRSLAFHRLSHSRDAAAAFGCDACGKRFKHAKALKAHAAVHTTRERPYLCHVCSKTFYSNSILSVHLRTHSDERPHACAVCGKAFRDKRDLQKHLRVHTGEAPFGCPHCGRRFKQKAARDSHVRGHLGIKRFACPVCGKACARQEHLKVHMRTHSGERPYRCDVCGRSFTQSHCLKTHMKTHRGEGGPAPPEGDPAPPEGDPAPEPAGPAP